MASFSVDKETYVRLEKEYNDAVKNNVSVFIFDGHEFLTDYAKYLIEYLKPNFE